MEVGQQLRADRVDQHNLRALRSLVKIEDNVPRTKLF